jgi:hypothetical protein
VKKQERERLKKTALMRYANQSGGEAQVERQDTDERSGSKRKRN